MDIEKKTRFAMTEDTKKHTLESCVKAVWRRTQRKHLSAGLLALCRWGIPLFFIGMAIDRFAYLPSSARAVGLIILLGVSFYQAWRNGWRHLRRFDPTRAALEIEKQQGGLASLLVTAVQFGQSCPPAGTSESLWNATRRQAEDAVQGLEPRKIVNFRGLRIPVRIAMVFAGLVIAFAIYNGPFLVAGLTRIFTPWVAIAYPTKTHLDLGKGDLVIKEGESARILIGVSGIVPETAELLLRTGDGDPREIDLPITGGNCEYAIASASRDFSYRIEAGDARSKWHKVRVIKAPRIEKVEVGLQFPAYLEREDETLEALTMTVPEETQVKWQLTLDRPIRDALLNRDGEEPRQLEVTNGGRQLVIDELVAASRGYSFSWVETEHGFDFTSPRYYLQVASDQAPQVELSSPETNLNALIGRQLDLGIRARDDHGIGSTSITYGVNMRPEQTVTLETPARNGTGEQILDWDYRKALPELQVGDTVSFLVEVSDKYPGPDGAQKARSETRRITFLSREEYLAEIERKKDRLLSRVRTTYRQERSAHELVRQLDPQDESFLQTCQLEAIRQEMLREQINETAREVQVLLDDLAANHVTDAIEGETLNHVRTSLVTIAEEQVAMAASLLREQTGVASNGNGKKPDPTLAIGFVNQAARELAALVLPRDVRSAREVFARESHMLAQEQATLRLLALRSEGEETAAALSKRQEELAVWTDELLVALQKGMRYDELHISVLGLTRRIKELRASGAEDNMRKAAALISDSKNGEAAALHTGIIAPLIAAEFSMRAGVEYSVIMDFRSSLDSLITSQQKLRKNYESMSAEDFEASRAELAKTQAELQAILVPSLLTPIPAPRLRLFDNILPELPPVIEIRTKAENAMTEAVSLAKAGERKPLIELQAEVEKQLTALSEILDRSSTELSLRTQGITSLVSDATERSTLIDDFEKRQIALLVQTEETALDEKNSVPLAVPQQLIITEIAAFLKEFRGENGAEKDVLPLLSRLDQVSIALDKAAGALKDNRPEDALGHQEKGADILAEARELALNQTARLGLLQGLFTFQRSVGLASDWMIDIVDEQTDLLKQTKAAKPDESAELITVMTNLRQCMIDIAPVLDLVAGRMDAGTPLLFAGTDLEDAILAIEDGAYLDAVDAQDVATESLAKVQTLVRALQSQTSYVAEIVEFLYEAESNTSLLAFRQQQLRERLETVEGNLPPELIAEQGSLQAETQSYGRQLEEATGMPAFSQAGDLMTLTLTAMKTGDAAAAIAQMDATETVLTGNAEQLFIVIGMLNGLPNVEVDSASAEELVRLVEVLAVATDQRNLSRQTETAKAGELVKLAPEQSMLAETCEKNLNSVPPHPMLVAAHQQLIVANKSLQSSDQASARRSQQIADENFRHFIIEQALILDTSVPPPAPSDPILSEAETTDIASSDTASFVSDFVSGEAPKDQRTEWEALGNRNRAALNQNFARELPLEYRGTLKNYYERIAK